MKINHRNTENKMKSYKLPVVLMALIALIGWVDVTISYAADHDFTGLPMTVDGWTDLLAMYQHPDRYNDSRIVYVSTSGNDSTGVYYSPGDPAIGNDPFNPAGTVAPYATLAAGYSRLRSGYPDMMLLKRGNVWTENLPRWTKSGRSSTERMSLGAYGTISTSRPKIGTFSTYYGQNQPQYAFSHNIFVGIEFAKFTRQIGGSNLLIEDCATLKGLGTGFIFQGYGPDFSDIVVRRCVISERYPPTDNSSHCQGLYAYNTINFLIEENFFDHNGWADNPGEGGSATSRNHNTYLGVVNVNTTMRYNISTRSSSKGFQPGGGGLILANLSVRDPIGIESSRSEDGYDQGYSSTIRYNVILDSYDTKSSAITNWGIRLNNVSSSLIEGNIIAHSPDGTNLMAITVEPNESDGEQMYVRNVTIRDNIIHDWGGISLRIIDNYPNLENLVIRNNNIHNSGITTNDQLTSHNAANADQITSSGNTFHSGRSASDWFRYNSNWMTLSTWMSTIGDTTSTSGQTLPSGDYSIQDYLTSIGETATLTAFYTEIQLQRRGSWDSRYTALPIINFVRSKFGKEPITLWQSQVPDPPLDLHIVN